MSSVADTIRRILKFRSGDTYFGPEDNRAMFDGEWPLGAPDPSEKTRGVRFWIPDTWTGYADTVAQDFRTGGEGGEVRRLYPIYSAGGTNEAIISDVISHSMTGVDTNGIAELPDGIAGPDVYVAWPGTISSVIAIGDQTGNFQIDIWKRPLAEIASISNADSITGDSPIAVSSGMVAQPNLFTWDTEFSGGEVLRFFVDSATTVRAVNIFIVVNRTL
jgi:hypothetical protein